MRLPVRARTLLLLLLLLPAGFLLAKLWPAGSPERPHILLISIDTCRADAMGFLGRRLEDGSSPTPVLDRLAKDALGALEAITPSPLTLPAHSSAFSGLFPDRHGVRENDSFRMPPEGERGFSLIAEDLRRAGYSTAAFVSAQPLERTYGLDAGFQTYSQPTREHNPKHFLAFRERNAAETVSEAIRFLERADSARPHFVFVHFFDPHHPYLRSAGHPALPAGKLGDYLGEVMYVDAQIGRLVDAWPFPRSRTAMILFSDHGESLGEHGEETHGYLLHQSTLRVPFLLVPPRGVPVPPNPDPALLVDIHPTIRDLAGLPAAANLDGRSLLRARSGEFSAWAETLYPYYQFQYAHGEAWFDGTLKLIQAGTGASMFAYRTDPGELSDLMESRPGEAGRLREGLKFFRGSRTPRRAVDVEVEANAAVPYMGGRPASFPLEPGEEANRRLPSMADRLAVVNDLDRARAYLAKRPPEPWNAVPLLLLHREEMDANPALLFWLARSLQQWGRSPEATLDVRMRKLREAEGHYRSHYERFRDPRSLDARIRTIWDRYEASPEADAARELIREAEGILAGGIDRPLIRALAASAREALGDSRGAIEDLQRAAELDPEDPRYGRDIQRIRTASPAGR